MAFVIHSRRRIGEGGPVGRPHEPGLVPTLPRQSLVVASHIAHKQSAYRNRERLEPPIDPFSDPGGWFSDPDGGAGRMGRSWVGRGTAISDPT
jgi:hypothetical protein